MSGDYITVLEAEAKVCHRTMSQPEPRKCLGPSCMAWRPGPEFEHTIRLEDDPPPPGAGWRKAPGGANGQQIWRRDAMPLGQCVELML